MTRVASIAFCYAAIIITTLWWSSQTIQKRSLYDRFIVRLEGSILHVSNIERARAFYTDKLDFDVVTSATDKVPVALRFNDRQTVYLELTRGQPAPDPQTVVLRVRNGFDEIFSGLKNRFNDRATPLEPTRYSDALREMPAGSMSTVTELPASREFAVKDPDGNVFLFYKARKILGYRY